MSQPQVIVSAMRSGAREFIERPTTTTDLLEAFVRLTAAQRKVDREGPRGKVFTVVNAKGGSGATTMAVNLALALQSAHGNVALVDIAPLGHAALHMNLKPQFTVADAIRNLHRLDSSLLESFMTRHSGGLQLLAGANTPLVVEPATAEFARLFDLLVGHFRYVVVDASRAWTRPRGWCAIFRKPCCWWPMPMSRPCGARPGSSNIWARPEAASGCAWC